jgi:flagellar biosynthesis/type III secretory pathway M-ring protein FliF/YscJ
MRDDLPARIDPEPVVEQSLEVAERIRQLAQNDLAVAANVVRLWLHETETRTI